MIIPLTRVFCHVLFPFFHSRMPIQSKLKPHNSFVKLSWLYGPRANKFLWNLFEGPKGLKVHLELYNQAKVPIIYSGTYLQGPRGQTFLRNFTIRLTAFLSKMFYTFQLFIFFTFYRIIYYCDIHTVCFHKRKFNIDS